jgi:WD40 repeat protein
MNKDESRVLVGISGGLINLIVSKSSRLMYAFTGHLDSVNHLALSPDGDRFVSASKDKTCMVWDLKKVLKEADESLRPN